MGSGSKPGKIDARCDGGGGVPVDGDSVNQAALSLAVQVMAPVPAFVTVNVCAVGLFPPTMPVKARLLTLS